MYRVEWNLMSMTVKIDLPDHLPALQKIAATQAAYSADSLELIAWRMATVAEDSLRTDLASHVRTGETLASIQCWLLSKSQNEVSYAMGTRTRGMQLYWLDQGRREVRPITARSLRWIDRNGMVVFSQYSRPTEALGIMRAAGLDALSRASAIIEEEIGVKTK